MAEFLTLVEAAKLVQNPLQKGVIEIFPRTSPVLEKLPLMSIAGQALVYNQEDTLPGIGFRAINVSYTPDVGVVNPVTERLMVLGGISQVDRALVKMQGTVNSIRAVHDAMKAKAAALEFTRAFFTGDSGEDPTEFDGLRTRLTGDQVVNYTGSDFLANLDKTIDRVQGTPDMLFMNKTIRRYLNQCVRDAGQATEVVSDSFGRQQTAYAGIPIGVIEDGPDGDPILGFDEGLINYTSIYAVRFGLGEFVCGIQSGSMDVEDLGLVNGVFYSTLVEWVVGLAVFHPKSAARLRYVQDPYEAQVATTTTTATITTSTTV